MLLLRRIYRKLIEKRSQFSSFLRILRLKISYPSLEINFGSYVDKGCHITCSDDSRMILHDVIIGKYATLRADSGGCLKIENTYIGHLSTIVASQKITIEAFCEIAEMVVIRDQDHIYGTGKIRNSGNICSPILIEENVWLGAKSSVFKGVTIGKNSVVAGSAVVTKNIPSSEVWAGIPAVKMNRKS